jgi:hypothetical protein
MTTVFSGGPGVTFPSDTDQDIFSGTAATLNTDTITNLKIGDIIRITDLTSATLNLDISGNRILFGNGQYITVDNLGIGLLVPRVTANGIEIRLQEPAQNDLNGDGRSDILWRADDGTLVDWLGGTNGAFTRNYASSVSNVSTDWHVAATGDFNGDGLVDILWRNDDGTLTDWISKKNGGFTDNWANAAAVVPTSWHVAATGDFNGDGRADIIWRADDGTMTDWLGTANGGFTDNWTNASAFVTTNWHIMGTGDFNGDGRQDVLWRADDGTLVDWLGAANGGFVRNYANSVASVPTNWSIAGIGDFNGDARADILWRATDGTVTEWLGTTSGGFSDNWSNAATSVPTNWHVAAIGDYNGDAIDDILWRADDGTLTNWLGTSTGSFADNWAHAATFVPTNWHVETHNLV